MALLFCDGFDDGLLTQKWFATSGSTVVSGGRFGGSCLRLSYNGSNVLRKSIPPTSTLIIGFALRIDNLPSRVDNLFLAYSDGGTTHHFSLQYTTGSNLSITRGATVLATSTKALGVNIWRYVEMKVFIHDTSGTIEVRVDGEVWLNFVGDTRNAGTSSNIDLLAFYHYVNFNSFIDDLYICDTNGTANNDFLGDSRIETLRPNANGSSSQFVGSDGNSIDNYLLVNEATPSTAEYVSSGVAGNKDLYNFFDLSNSASTVKGVQLNTYVAKSDTGSRSVTNLVKSGIAEATGATTTLSSSYTVVSHVQEIDPSTSAAWTANGINTAEFGVRVD